MKKKSSEESKRILYITQWFDPEPMSRGLSFAEKLRQKGFDFEILTGFPNYPLGKIYKGYTLKLFQKETLNKFLINRVFLYPSHDKSSLRRAMNYISFAISATLFGIFKIKRPKVIYAYHPPLTVGICAVILKLYFRVPLIYDIQDMWPDTLKATGMLSNKFIIKIIYYLCKLVYSLSDEIIVLSPGFKRLLIKRGVSSKKINVIYNWANIDNKSNQYLNKR